MSGSRVEPGFYLRREGEISNICVFCNVIANDIRIRFGYVYEEKQARVVDLTPIPDCLFFGQGKMYYGEGNLMTPKSNVYVRLVVLNEELHCGVDVNHSGEILYKCRKWASPK